MKLPYLQDWTQAVRFSIKAGHALFFWIVRAAISSWSRIAQGTWLDFARHSRLSRR
jgi:hypothetical protein